MVLLKQVLPILVISFMATLQCHGSLQCSTSEDANGIVRRLGTDYITIKNEEIKPVKHTDAVTTRDGCRYKFVETKKDRNQIPQSFQTAQCEVLVKGLCDPRCKPVVYMMPVLKMSNECDENIGQKVWMTSYARIVVGYNFQAQE